MRVISYSDELNDDFSGTKIKTVELPEDYPYFSKNPLRKLFDFVLYEGLVMPAALIWQKLVYGEKVVNRKALKACRKEGYFLYGNHTRFSGDAFCPTHVAFPKKPYIVAGPDSVSVPLIGNLTASMGCVPLPTSMGGMRNFRQALRTHSEKGHAVVIYPEAHIWPYYTGIRPFRDSSFRYPAELMKPVFTFTAAYHSRRFFKKPGVTVYIDGPFYPDPHASVRTNQKNLRDAAFAAMKERSKNSTAEYIHYEKVPASEQQPA